MNMMEDVNVKLMYQGRVRTFRKSELRPLREEAMTEMQQLVMELMDDRAEGRPKWKSTTTDLVEMIDDVYTLGDGKDARGCDLTFSYMVRAVCRRLVKPVPRNPRSYAYRARMRKSMRQSSLLDRWVLMKLNGCDPRRELLDRS